MADMDAPFIAIIVLSAIPIVFSLGWKIRKHIKDPKTRNKYSLFSMATVTVMAIAVGFLVQIGRTEWLIYTLVVPIPFFLHKIIGFIARWRKKRMAKRPAKPSPIIEKEKDEGPSIYETSENLEMF